MELYNMLISNYIKEPSNNSKNSLQKREKEETKKSFIRIPKPTIQQKLNPLFQFHKNFPPLSKNFLFFFYFLFPQKYTVWSENKRRNNCYKLIDDRQSLLTHLNLSENK